MLSLDLEKRGYFRWTWQCEPISPESVEPCSLSESRSEPWEKGWSLKEGYLLRVLRRTLGICAPQDRSRKETYRRGKPDWRAWAKAVHGNRAIWVVTPPRAAEESSEIEHWWP